MCYEMTRNRPRQIFIGGKETTKPIIRAGCGGQIGAISSEKNESAVHFC